MARGVGYVVRSLADHVEVIGIQPIGAPAMALSWRQGTVVETDHMDTIADGVAGRCPIPEVLDDLLVMLDERFAGRRITTILCGAVRSRPRRIRLGDRASRPGGRPDNRGGRVG
jgi:hypothetical protein